MHLEHKTNEADKSQAGEDLHEDDDDDEDDEEGDDEDVPTDRQVENGSVVSNQIQSRTGLTRAGTSKSIRGQSGERQPLLSRGNTSGPGTLSRGVSKSRHRRMKSSAGQGTASFTQAVLMVSPACLKVYAVGRKFHS